MIIYSNLYWPSIETAQFDHVCIAAGHRTKRRRMADAKSAASPCRERRRRRSSASSSVSSRVDDESVQRNEERLAAQRERVERALSRQRRRLRGEEITVADLKYGKRPRQGPWSNWVVDPGGRFEICRLCHAFGRKSCFTS